MTTFTGSHVKDAVITKRGGGNLPSTTVDTWPEPTTDAALAVDN